MGRYDDAIAYFKKWLSLVPNAEGGHAMLACVLSMKGLHKEALAQNDSSGDWRILNTPLLLAKSGNLQLAREFFNRNRVQLERDPYTMSTFYALTGQKDSAFVWLGRFYKEPNGSLYWFSHDHFLDGLRDDPRFKVLLRKMNLFDREVEL
jgi:hypothetical protein